jgi:MraZ protein
LARYFIGSATHKLDAKGRVSLPSDYRAVLRAQGSEDSFVVVPRPGADPCHLAFSGPGHERLIERIGSADYPSPAHRRETRRRFISEARPVALEDGGRFVLPRDLREALGLDKEVQFVGDGETFQIWEPGAWESLHGAAEEADAVEIDFAGLV